MVRKSTEVFQMKSYLVLGAGMMGEAVAYDLLQSRKTKRVSILDYDLSKAKDLEQRLRDERVDVMQADASDIRFMKGYMHGFDAAVSAVAYDFNLALTEAAISAGTHLCDLGGNNRIVEKQFALHEQAKKRGVKIVPDTGIAPGAVSILTAHGINRLEVPPEDIDYVKIRVGGLPLDPEGLLRYMKVFSVHGWINECKEPTEIIHDYERKTVPSMTYLETLEFPAPFGRMEAVYTSGGSSTLTKTFEHTIRRLDYKTIRYPGHWPILAALNKLGFFDEKPAIDNTSPRQLTEHLLDKAVSYDGKDVILARITLGTTPVKGKARELEFNLIDIHDDSTGHTAMQRTTGYSASIIAQMMANNIITDTGVLYQELSVPPAAFVRRWRKRGIKLTEDRRTLPADL
jgi:lysine 6-dehydrogenase